MTSQEFGELIRTHREAKGLSVEDLATRFKLSVNTIRAIEDGSLDHMPHVVYAKGFVRACAQAVEVPRDELEEGLAALFPEDPADDAPVRSGPISTRGPRPRDGGGGAGIFVSLVLLLLLGGAGWLVYSNFDTISGFASETLASFSVSDDDEAEPQDVPATPEPAPAREAAAAAPPEEPAPPLAEVAPETSGVETASVAEPRPAPDAAPPSAPAETVAETVPVSGKQVAIQAKEECWVQVTVDGGGSRTFTIYRGDTSVVPYKNRLTLVIGNSGGVSLSHNGKPYALNGRPNERRTLIFQ